MAADAHKQLIEEAIAHCLAWEAEHEAALTRCLQAVKSGEPIGGANLAGLATNLLAAGGEERWVADFLRHLRALGTTVEKRHPAPPRARRRV